MVRQGLGPTMLGPGKGKNTNVDILGDFQGFTFKLVPTSQLLQIMLITQFASVSTSEQ